MQRGESTLVVALVQSAVTLLFLVVTIPSGVIKNGPDRHDQERQRHGGLDERDDERGLAALHEHDLGRDGEDPDGCLRRELTQSSASGRPETRAAETAASPDRRPAASYRSWGQSSTNWAPARPASGARRPARRTRSTDHDLVEVVDDDVRHEGRTAVERDEREHVRRAASRRRLLLGARSSTSRSPRYRAASATPRPGRSRRRSGLRGGHTWSSQCTHHGTDSSTPVQRVEERDVLGVEGEVDAGELGHDVLTSTLVADIALDPSEKPVPCTTACSHDGTGPSGCASPRSWRTASIVRIMPPRMSGWLFESPPPSVFSGSTPFGDRECAVAHEPSALALGAEPEVLEREENRDGEGVVDRGVVDVGLGHAGLGERWGAPVLDGAAVREVGVGPLFQLRGRLGLAEHPRSWACRGGRATSSFTRRNAPPPSDYDAAVHPVQRLGDRWLCSRTSSTVTRFAAAARPG